MKDLIRGTKEKNASDSLRKPRVCNRRYPIKAMHLGVIDFPQDKDNFDDQIILERVSHAKVLTRASKNKHLRDDVYTKEAIKRSSIGN